MLTNNIYLSNTIIITYLNIFSQELIPYSNNGKLYSPFLGINTPNNINSINNMHIRNNVSYFNYNYNDYISNNRNALSGYSEKFFSKNYLAANNTKLSNKTLTFNNNDLNNNNSYQIIQPIVSTPKNSSSNKNAIGSIILSKNNSNTNQSNTNNNTNMNSDTNGNTDNNYTCYNSEQIRNPNNILMNNINSSLTNINVNTNINLNPNPIPQNSIYNDAANAYNTLSINNNINQGLIQNQNFSQFPFVFQAFEQSNKQQQPKIFPYENNANTNNKNSSFTQLKSNPSNSSFQKCTLNDNYKKMILTNKKFNCHCEKSKCQKKYCECLANGEVCDGKCNCRDCKNCGLYKKNSNVSGTVNNNISNNSINNNNNDLPLREVLEKGK